jgi:hypothetical protein
MRTSTIGATRDLTFFNVPLSPDTMENNRRMSRRYHAKKHIERGTVPRYSRDFPSVLVPKAKECIRHIIDNGFIEMRMISKICGSSRAVAVVDLMTDLAPVFEDYFDLPLKNKYPSKVVPPCDRVYFAINWDMVRDKEEFIGRFM